MEQKIIFSRLQSATSARAQRKLRLVVATLMECDNITLSQSSGLSVIVSCFSYLSDYHSGNLVEVCPVIATFLLSPSRMQLSVSSKYTQVLMEQEN